MLLQTRTPAFDRTPDSLVEPFLNKLPNNEAHCHGGSSQAAVTGHTSSSTPPSLAETAGASLWPLCRFARAVDGGQSGIDRRFTSPGDVKSSAAAAAAAAARGRLIIGFPGSRRSVTA